MLDFSKPMKTAGGHPVTFLSHDGPGGFSHIGYYEFPGGSEVTRWNNNGASEGFVVHRHLIQAEEPVVRWGVVDRNTGRFCQIAEPKLHGLYNGELFKLTFDGDSVIGELVK